MNDYPGADRPNPRNALGVLAFAIGITVYALMVMMLSVWIGPIHWLLEAIYYVVFGLAWLWPARALMRWMAPQADVPADHD